MSDHHDPSRDLCIVAGFRTPFTRAGGALAGALAGDLATHVLREVLDRTGVDPRLVDEVVFGCAGPDPTEANVARLAALRAGVPAAVPAVTVMRNCASGMEAVATAAVRARAGLGEVFLVGGTESMSNYPLLMGKPLVRFFTRLGKARSMAQKLAALASLRPRHLAPRVALREGLTDATIGMSMGDTAERLARQFGIGRGEMDVFALQSHRRATAAQKSGVFAAEIAPLVPPPDYGGAVTADDGIRTEQTLEALGRLKPVFDPREGDVTVGNSCQITDGAVAMLCTTVARAQALGVQPLAVVRGHAVAGLPPQTMGLGPVFAAPLALRQAGLGVADLDLVELHEAFAGQVLANTRAFASERFGREQLGLPGALGELDPDRLNVHGGAIALGHPIAASGARLLLTLARSLRARRARYGLAALCIGGGQGQAFVLEAA